MRLIIGQDAPSARRLPRRLHRQFATAAAIRGQVNLMDSGQGTMGNSLGNGRRALAEEVPVGYKRTEVGEIEED